MPACLSACLPACSEVRGGGCDHPFCDSLVLTWSGPAMKLNDAVSLTNPNRDLDASCGGADRRRKLGGRAIAGKTPEKTSKDASKAEPVKAGPAAKVANTDKPTYFQSGADVYYGPVTISSRKYDIKYHTGFMQYVDWYTDEATGDLTASDVAGKHLVQPFTYNLQMLKPQEGY